MTAAASPIGSRVERNLENAKISRIKGALNQVLEQQYAVQEIVITFLGNWDLRQYALQAAAWTFIGRGRVIHDLSVYRDTLTFAAPLVVERVVVKVDAIWLDVCLGIFGQGKMPKREETAQVATIYSHVLMHFYQLKDKTPLQRAQAIRQFCQVLALAKQGFVALGDWMQSEMSCQLLNQLMTPGARVMLSGQSPTYSLELDGETSDACFALGAFYDRASKLQSEASQCLDADLPGQKYLEALRAAVPVLDRIESTLIDMKKEAETIVKMMSQQRKKEQRQRVLTLLLDVHMAVRLLRAVYSNSGNEIGCKEVHLYREGPLRAFMNSENPFISKGICPELPILQRAYIDFIDKISVINRTAQFFEEPEKRMQLAHDIAARLPEFSHKLKERAVIYQFLYTMLKRQEELLDPTSKKTYEQYAANMPLPTIDEFSTPMPLFPSLAERRSELKRFKASYEHATDLDSSFVVALPKKSAAAKKKKKKGPDPFDPNNMKRQEMTQAAPAPAAAAAGAAAGAGAGATKVKPVESAFKPNQLKYAPRVLEKFQLKAEGDQREDVWAHAFTPLLDRFLGTPYCYTFTSRRLNNEIHTQHCFIVVVEDEELCSPPETYIATYAIDQRGVCYHRCLQRKSHSEFFNKMTSSQVHEMLEFPTLQEAAILENAKAYVEEEGQVMAPDAMGIVTIKDKKHNLTLQVLPWQAES